MKITRTKYFGLHADRVRELAKEIGRMDVVKKGELADRIRGRKTKNSFKTAWIASRQDWAKRHERRMEKIYDHLGMGNPAQQEATRKVREREKDLYKRLTKDDDIYFNTYPEYRRGDYRYHSKTIKSRHPYSKPTSTPRQEMNLEGEENPRYYRDLKRQVDDYIKKLKETDPAEYERVGKLMVEDPGFDKLRKESMIEELLEKIRNNK